MRRGRETLADDLLHRIAGAFLGAAAGAVGAGKIRRFQLAEFVDRDAECGASLFGLRRKNSQLQVRVVFFRESMASE